MIVSSTASVATTLIQRRTIARDQLDGLHQPEITCCGCINDSEPRQCDCTNAVMNTSVVQAGTSVLVIGDSLYWFERGSKDQIESKLAQHDVKVTFVHSNLGGYCGSSYFWVQCLDEVVRSADWDAISFNWGLHDMPRNYADINLTDHKDNLRKIYAKLNTKLNPLGQIIFQKTTPVAPVTKNCRESGDVVVINEALEDVAVEFIPPITVNDVYRPFVEQCQSYDESKHYPDNETCPKLQKEDGEHFSDEGRDFFAELVSSSILKALKKGPRSTSKPWWKFTSLSVARPSG